MDKSQEPLQSNCLNCGASAKGGFCQNCGQRNRTNADRSLGRLFGEFLGNIFFIDNKFLLSVGYLFRFPARMTIEFLEGKRKKFIAPVTLFLFFNLIYFIVNPLSDYSISLYDQVYSQPYSPLIEDWVKLKLKTKGLVGETNGITYKNMSDNISKSIMIINVPMIAFLVFLIAYKRRRYYFDSLIFTFHFFSLFIACWIFSKWSGMLIDFLPIPDDSIVFDISSALFVTCIPLLYAILSIKKFLDIRWYWAIPSGLLILLAVLLTNLVYRFIILVLTIWVL